MMLWPAALLLVSAQAASSGSARLEQMRRQLQATGSGGARLEQMRRRLQGEGPPECPACGPGWADFVAGMDRLQAATGDLSMGDDPFAVGRLLVASNELVCRHLGDLRCIIDQGCATEDDMGSLLEGTGCTCDACPGSVAVQAHLMTILFLAFGGGLGSDNANITMPTEEELLDMQCPLVPHVECMETAPACQEMMSEGENSINLNASDLSGQCEGWEQGEQGPTCGEVREQYREQACCGAPDKEFHAPGSMRRLQAGVGAGAVAEKVRAALRRAKAKGGAAEAKALARRIQLLLDGLSPTE